MADLAVAVDRLVGPIDIVDDLASDDLADLEACAECDDDPFLAWPLVPSPSRPSAQF